MLNFAFCKDLNKTSSFVCGTVEFNNTLIECFICALDRHVK